MVNVGVIGNVYFWSTVTELPDSSSKPLTARVALSTVSPGSAKEATSAFHVVASPCIVKPDTASPASVAWMVSPLTALLNVKVTFTGSLTKWCGLSNDALVSEGNACSNRNSPCCSASISMPSTVLVPVTTTLYLPFGWPLRFIPRLVQLPFWTSASPVAIVAEASRVWISTLRVWPSRRFAVPVNW